MRISLGLAFVLLCVPVSSRADEPAEPTYEVVEEHKPLEVHVDLMADGLTSFTDAAKFQSQVNKLAWVLMNSAKDQLRVTVYPPSTCFDAETEIAAANLAARATALRIARKKNYKLDPVPDVVTCEDDYKKRPDHGHTQAISVRSARGVSLTPRRLESDKDRLEFLKAAEKEGLVRQVK